MKTLIATGLGIMAFFAVGSSASAQTTAPGAPPASPSTKLTSIINDIAVPLEVLEYAQTEHQGFAVIEVKQMNRHGQQVYRLRVDNDDQGKDNDGFYLIYDKDWKLASDKVIIYEDKPKEEPPKPEETPKPEDKKPEEKPVERRDDKPDPVVKPEEPAVTEPSEETSGGGNDGGDGGEEPEASEPQ